MSASGPPLARTLLRCGALLLLLAVCTEQQPLDTAAPGRAQPLPLWQQPPVPQLQQGTHPLPTQQMPQQLLPSLSSSFRPSSVPVLAQARTQALVVADPKAPSALNCFATGKGVQEAEMGKVARFDVVVRDIYGDSQPCQPDWFVVNVVPLSTAWDEDDAQCEDAVASKCTTCRSRSSSAKTTVCFDGQVHGAACGFSYTPHSPGFFRITVLTPSQNGDGLTNIQGSPYRLHVDDGALFLPGVSVAGYFGVFLASILGAAVLLSVVLWAAWGQFKGSLPPSEDEEEMQRLSQIAVALEERAQVREHNTHVLTQLPRLAAAPGLRAAEFMEREDDEEPAASLEQHGLEQRGFGAGLQGGPEYFTERVSRGLDDILDISTPVRSCMSDVRGV